MKYLNFIFISLLLTLQSTQAFKKEIIQHLQAGSKIISGGTTAALGGLLSTLGTIVIIMHGIEKVGLLNVATDRIDEKGCNGFTYRTCCYPHKKADKRRISLLCPFLKIEQKENSLTLAKESEKNRRIKDATQGITNIENDSLVCGYELVAEKAHKDLDATSWHSSSFIPLLSMPVGLAITHAGALCLKKGLKEWNKIP